MEPTIVDFLSNDQLAQLLDFDPTVHWTSDDGAAALRHQLAAALGPDLALLPGTTARLDQALSEVNQDTRFLDQLLSQTPHLEILLAIKEFGRTMREQPNSPLASGPATVLYFAAIAAALVRSSERISQLTNVELRDGFIWALEQRGAESLSPLFESALRKIATGAI